MKDKLFNKLWKDAISQPSKELYLSEYGYPDWFDEISQDPSEVMDTLGRIHDVAHMSMRDIINTAKLSQTSFADKFCIPLRTVQNWCTEAAGQRKCPDYIRLAVCRQLGILEV